MQDQPCQGKPTPLIFNLAATGLISGSPKCDTSPVCHKCSVDVSKPGGEFMRKTCIRQEPSKVGGVSACEYRLADRVKRC